MPYIGKTPNDLADLSIDTTPKLGGDLDVNGKVIISATNGNISITPNGSGDVILAGLKYPQADGTPGYVLKTDGSAQLSWVAQTTDTNTTYSVQDGELSQNNLTDTLKTNYGTGYSHSQATHAPSGAEANATNTAITTADQSWSGSQRGTPSVVTDGTLDLTSANNFKYTPGAADNLEFSGEASSAGQSGFITIINTTPYVISLVGNVKKGTSWDVSTAGTYLVSYYCDGTNVYVSASEALA